MSVNFDALLDELVTTWHSTIPVSEFMQIRPQQFDGEQLTVAAPLAPNINLHQTMFAGSIYTLLTLSGWGLLWLMQRSSGLQGDIVLADANIRYLAPVTGTPLAKVSWPGQDLSPLGRGKRVKVTLEVSLWCADKLCAQFTGQYVSLPGGHK